MGNSHCISAAAGRDELKKVASRVFLTGGFWNGTVAMVAAPAIIRMPERDNVPQRLHDVGEAPCAGLRERAEKHGLKIGVSGPPALPFMTFANESNLRRSQHFGLETPKRGVFYRPRHNWILCATHGPADIDQAFAIAKNTSPTEPMICALVAPTEDGR